MYDIDRLKYREIKEYVIDNECSSDEVKSRFNLDSKQMWFLFDKLLQEKYNHLYKREKLTKVSMSDYVYCDHEGFGRGIIMSIFDEDLMLVKFDKRELPTMCSSSTFVTVFDEVKRKLTKL